MWSISVLLLATPDGWCNCAYEMEKQGWLTWDHWRRCGWSRQSDRLPSCAGSSCLHHPHLVTNHHHPFNTVICVILYTGMGVHVVSFSSKNIPGTQQSMWCTHKALNVYCTPSIDFRTQVKVIFNENVPLGWVVEAEAFKRKFKFKAIIPGPTGFSKSKLNCVYIWKITKNRYIWFISKGPLHVC